MARRSSASTAAARLALITDLPRRSSPVNHSIKTIATLSSAAHNRLPLRNKNRKNLRKLQTTGALHRAALRQPRTCFMNVIKRRSAASITRTDFASLLADCYIEIHHEHRCSAHLQSLRKSHSNRSNKSKSIIARAETMETVHGLVPCLRMTIECGRSKQDAS